MRLRSSRWNSEKSQTWQKSMRTVGGGLRVGKEVFSMFCWGAVSIGKVGGGGGAGAWVGGMASLSTSMGTESCWLSVALSSETLCGGLCGLRGRRTARPNSVAARLEDVVVEGAGVGRAVLAASSDVGPDWLTSSCLIHALSSLMIVRGASGL